MPAKVKSSRASSRRSSVKEEKTMEQVVKMVPLESAENKKAQTIKETPKVDQPTIQLGETNKNIMSATVKIKQGNNDKKEEVKPVQIVETHKITVSDRKINDQTQELQDQDEAPADKKTPPTIQKLDLEKLNQNKVVLMSPTRKTIVSPVLSFKS